MLHLLDNTRYYNYQIFDNRLQENRPFVEALTDLNHHVALPVIAKKLEIKTGDPAQTVSLSGYGDLDVLWYSAAPDIANVDMYTGEVTAVAKGSIFFLPIATGLPAGSL